MIPPISPGELWEIFKVTKELIDKIKDAPKRVEQVHKRLKDLQAQLQRLKDNFVDQKGKIDGSLSKSAASQLQRILGDLYANIKDVHKILREWYTSTGSLQSPFNVLPKAVFALGKNPERLEKLEVEIDYHRKELSEWLSMTIFEKINKLGTQPQPSPSPSPAPKQLVRIMVVDKDNIGRSKIVEAYAKLVQNWTVQSKGKWMIKNVHSAGFNVSHKSECVNQVKGMGSLYPGNAPPHPMATLALFDNNLFAGEHKDGVRTWMEQTRSRGIKNTLFRDYDYILVLTHIMKTNMDLLRQRLIKQYGPSAAPEGKGKVVILGQYGGKETRYIVQPPETGDAEKDRRNWNRMIGILKVSFKNFLKFELDWHQPR